MAATAIAPMMVDALMLGSACAGAPMSLGLVLGGLDFGWVVPRLPGNGRAGPTELQLGGGHPVLHGRWQQLVGGGAFGLQAGAALGRIMLRQDDGESRSTQRATFFRVMAVVNRHALGRGLVGDIVPRPAQRQGTATARARGV